jgi:Family of unknown function (DUF5362)
MEDIQQSSIFEFNIDEEGKSNLAAIAQWANINAIVGFTGLGISIIGFVIAMAKIGRMGSTGYAGSLGIFIGFIIGLLLNITLIYAAINIKKGLELSNQGHFVTGLSKLASYFKIFGILTIIGLVLIVLVLLFVMMMGYGRGF